MKTIVTFNSRPLCRAQNPLRRKRASGREERSSATSICSSAKTAVIVFVLGLISLAAARGDILTLIQTGDSGPSHGDTFDLFGLPTLNDSGQVAYDATLNGVLPTDSGIYQSMVTIPGATELVRAGDAAPGGGQFSSEFSTVPTVTSSGLTQFADLSLNPVSSSGFYSISSPGVSQRLAGEGDSAPDGNGTLNGPLTPPQGSIDYSDNNAGQVAFYETLSGTHGGTADNEAIFRAGTSPGSLAEIARKGNPVPDGNGSFGQSLGTRGATFGTPSINDNGTVAFFAGVVGSNNQIPGSNSSFDAGIFAGNGSGIQQVARAGEPVPGGGTLLSFLSGPAINNNNQVAFSAVYYLGTQRNAIYRSDGGTLTEIAHAGEALPGGGFILSVSDSVVINNAGQVASLISTNTGSSNLGGGGIIRGSGGALTLIARNGESTPRGGATIMAAFDGQTFAMNALGDVAFTAELDTNPNDVVTTDSKGLFLYTDRFGLFEIAQLGDALNGSTITGLGLAGANAATGASSLQMGLNDSDQVVFQFALANGKEGISVWSIPEPGSVSLLALSAGCIGFFSLARRSALRERGT